VNAGHLPPLVRRASGTYERLEGTNMALGIWDHSTYDERRTFLAAGDMLVAYSDGITEAEGDDNRPFDEIGLKTIIDGHGWATAKELGWETFAAVERHSGARRLRDDLTVLVARRLPPLPV